MRLRDRLVALADGYPPTAATVDLTALRRAAHGALDVSVRRHEQGWQALTHLHERALSTVGDQISSADGTRRLRLERGDVGTSLLAEAMTAAGVVVHSESGVGKSALVLGAVSAARTEPEATQAVVINLRHLPASTLEFESLLGSPLATLLTELSAPWRLLVVDAADAVAEGRLDQFRHLVDAAHTAQVGVLAITAGDSRQVVRDTIETRVGTVVEYEVHGLTDAEVDEVVSTFEELSNLAQNSRSRELLRRPVVVDLLLRGGISGVPLSDADAMRQVWRDLVRRREQADRGTPDAREVALLRLADLALTDGDPLDVVGAIDPRSLDGLRRDGLLRTPAHPFHVGPEFAHDEVRRYAVARRLLNDTDPTGPRWRPPLGARRGSPRLPGAAVRSGLRREPATREILACAGRLRRNGRGRPR